MGVKLVLGYPHLILKWEEAISALPSQLGKGTIFTYKKHLGTAETGKVSCPQYDQTKYTLEEKGFFITSAVTTQKTIPWGKEN